jgi:hypothetical protein
MFVRVVDEVCALGAAAGVDLPNTTRATIADFGQALPAGSLSSLHDDLVARRSSSRARDAPRVRREAFPRHRLAAPMSEAVSAVLGPTRGPR